MSSSDCLVTPISGSNQKPPTTLHGEKAPRLKFDSGKSETQRASKAFRVSKEEICCSERGREGVRLFTTERIGKFLSNSRKTHGGCERMDPGYIAETSRHLEKQNELLWETYRSMSHELQKLQVEEEMLMRKFYEVMSAHGLTKKKDANSFLDELLEKKNDTMEDFSHQQSQEAVDQTSSDEEQ
ncbi:hypothetical protein ACET3Z_017959 [Daucus carota]